MKKTVRQLFQWAGMAVFLSCVLASCRNSFMKPASSGRPYEMLVVVDDSLWQRPAGRALFDILDTDVPGLPQPERYFRISQTSPSRFDQILNIFRNIIIVKIDKTQYTQTKMRFARDEYAQPQIILSIQSPSEADFEAYLKEHGAMILDFFHRVEMNRLGKQLKKEYSTVVKDMAQEMFDCQWLVPKEIVSYKKGKDFFWAASNSATVMANVCMYAYPYEGPETFTKEYVLAKRDSFMKANIPGAKPTMYMATDTLCTFVKPIMVKGQYAMETRGLWQMENDAMGGPFVSHSRVDTLNNRVVVVEGFLYSPEKMNRGMIRRLEGSLYTLNLPAEQTEEIELGIPEVEVVASKEDK
ncbi:MAG: DUF4837 family protein [Paraprevotella sp.]|nr:DUF4837 family protein [Paraprevotella sp.]MBP3472515.1 DUF4837 family protein [Paraprevotella sp.]